MSVCTLQFKDLIQKLLLPAPLKTQKVTIFLSYKVFKEPENHQFKINKNEKLQKASLLISLKMQP